MASGQGGAKSLALRVSVEPAPANAAQVAQAAKRILGNVTAGAFQPSGAIARRLGVSPRTLGRITGEAALVPSTSSSLEGESTSGT